MKKSILNLGTKLSKTDQKQINGGFGLGDFFIGSGCRTNRTCGSLLQSAISNGANPLTTRCFQCTTEFGQQGVEVRIFG